MGLREELLAFILNPDQKGDLSESPEKAVVSLYCDRDASYSVYIKTLDEVQAAYFSIYADRARLTPEAYRRLDLNNAYQRQRYERARAGVPMNISLADGQ